MRTGMPIIVVLVLSIMQTSCGTVDPVMTMTGEMATVRLGNGSEYFVELLAVGDSSILCLENGNAAPGGKSPPTDRVKEISTSSIAQIRISGFRNNRWAIGVLCFQVIPAVGLTVAASSAKADAGAVFAVAMIPAVFTAFLYATSGVPTPTFENPISNKDLLELRTYARFGGKLTSAQKGDLLRMHGQGGVP